MQDKVVAKDLGADDKLLAMITGANQGGRSCAALALPNPR